MKILALSDKVVNAIYSSQVTEMYGDADLVVGCGDLPYYYLEYIVTMLMVPVVYVHGNHDKPQHMADGRVVTAPEGCISVEDRVVEVNGLLVAGLGGSMRYRPRSPFQYSEAEMTWRVLRLVPKLLWNRLRHGRFVDIFVTHSPPYGVHDGGDLPHRGFRGFIIFLRLFKPRYMLHGHKHVYRRDTATNTRVHHTAVVNVYPNRVIDWHDDTPISGSSL